MAMKQTICGYTFEKVSNEEYLVTMPDGTQMRKYYLAAESLMKQLKKKAGIPTNEVQLTVYQQGSKEWHKLLAFAELLNSFQDKAIFRVENCCKDASSGTGWTTIVALRKSDGAEYMFLNQREQKELLEASYTDFSKLVSAKLSYVKKA